MLSVDAVVRATNVGESEKLARINSVFDVGPRAVAFRLVTSECAPDWPPGSVWVVDPDEPKEPGKWVVGARGPDRRPVVGILSLASSAHGVITIITPSNANWPAARSDIERVEVIAVMTEGTRKG